MLVIAEIDALILGETSKCLGSAQLVIGSHLESALGTHVAVILDCVHNKSEAVHLRQVPFGDLDFLFIGLVGILGFLCFSIVFITFFFLLCWGVLVLCIWVLRFAL